MTTTAVSQERRQTLRPAWGNGDGEEEAGVRAIAACEWLDVQGEGEGEAQLS